LEKYIREGGISSADIKSLAFCPKIGKGKIEDSEKTRRKVLPVKIASPSEKNCEDLRSETKYFHIKKKSL